MFTGLCENRKERTEFRIGGTLRPRLGSRASWVCAARAPLAEMSDEQSVSEDCAAVSLIAESETSLDAVPNPPAKAQLPAVGVKDMLQHVAAGAPAREADHGGPRHQIGIALARRRAAHACHAARPPGRPSGAARASGGKVGGLCGHGGGLPGGGVGTAPRPPTKSLGKRRPRPPDATPRVHAV